MPVPRLADRYNGRANSINVLRIVFAFAVLVAHSWPLVGRHSAVGRWTVGQTNLGDLALDGFFVLSGFLITGSALRFSMPRYFWHRALRILPGYWACLVLTAFVAAPLTAYYERGTLGGLLSHPQGPLQYLKANWFLAMDQFAIGGLLKNVPFASPQGGYFNGSLWTLKYEAFCYLVVALLALSGVLLRAKRAVLFFTLAVFWIQVEDFIRGDGMHALPPSHGPLGPYPLVGVFSQQDLIYLLFFFLCGASAKLYADRLPIHGAIAAPAAVALIASCRLGGFYVIGTVAWAYLVLYAAVALPHRLHSVGQRRDYSYGIYIYAFPVQQVVVLTTGTRFGLAGFMAISAVGTVAIAALSWHLIERPAMSLRDWTPWFVRRSGEPLPAGAVIGLPLQRDEAAVGPTSAEESSTAWGNEVTVISEVVVPQPEHVERESA